MKDPHTPTSEQEFARQAFERGRAQAKIDIWDSGVSHARGWLRLWSGLTGYNNTHFFRGYQSMLDETEGRK